MNVKHWAKYLIPGSLFPEDEVQQLDERSVEAAMEVAPHGAYCFTLYDTAIADFDFDAGLFKVIPIPQNESERIYMGGQVFTCDELRALAVEEGDPSKYRILIANVTRYPDGQPVEGRAIRCRTGNWQPFEDDDVLVPLEVAA